MNAPLALQLRIAWLAVKLLLLLLLLDATDTMVLYQNY
jgi:hypothetical protein